MHFSHAQYFAVTVGASQKTPIEPRHEINGFDICENKYADQLHSHRLCFRYIESTIPLLPNPKFQASNRLKWLYSPVCVGPVGKTRRPVFL